MSGYVIAYIIIGVLLVIFILSFVAVLIIPMTKLYKDKHSQTKVVINVDKAGNQEVYVNGVKQDLPNGNLNVDVPSAREFDEKKDVKAGK